MNSIIDYATLKSLHDRIMNGDQSAIQDLFGYKPQMQEYALDVIERYKLQEFNQNEIQTLDVFMRLCNIIYNNFDSMCLIDDGIYDMLMNIYKTILPNDYQVGGEPVPISFENIEPPDDKLDGLICPIITIDESRKPVNDWLFKNDLFVTPPLNIHNYDYIDRSVYTKNNKRSVVVPHKYSKLVGTLDKCKFTLIKEAVAAGVENDPTIKIFERDFLGAHVAQGIINPNHIELLVELKMDGLSVEADVTDEILSARSRGDTGLDLANDMTMIFKGYKFANCPKIDKSFGMKFECIITKSNLERLAVLKGRSYKNARNGVIGLLGAADAYAYRDLLTLVPLETSLNVDPISEIKFMNKYYTKDVYLPYAVISGDYNTVLYQVYEFVKEAEALRAVTDYLYDGVVIHYIDPKIRSILGRVNSVNKYSMAIKFNPMQKRTIFRGYTFEVGQNGFITPMGHYDPVEFIGTIHTKSSCHSYSRFQELNLRYGDVVDLTYVNDVMPYLTKPFNGIDNSNNPPIPFPTNCPCCGSPLVLSDSGDSVYCLNMNCPDRQVARLTNMLDKLSFKGFAESAIRKLNIHSFTEFLAISELYVRECLGEKNGENFIAERNKFLSTPIQDYRLIGAIGFTNIASATWKKILQKIPIDALINDKTRNSQFYSGVIKGIGPKTVETILTEFPNYIQDIETIRHLPNIVYTYGQESKTIRWTGIRDNELEEQLCAMGYDAKSTGSVSKETNMLVVPYAGFISTKFNKIGPNTIIVTIDDLKSNLDYYLGML